ncbi:hypothetical protein M0811_04056 [Anaeramoeba ignava]|uniref:COP9 signalosome complex subunit 8 n=1 Tax=Anaeramoeba ignava TaxID=1746090 RepID=A0A9Q0LTM8_ANAIG|nr:hypothetical protein M0811_04056 [Anaeramoeba ignava]
MSKPKKTTIDNYLEKKDFAKAIKFCEDIEAISHGTDTKPMFHQQIILYLITNDTIGARFLYKRLPTEIKKTKVIDKLWELTKIMWNSESGGMLEIIPSINNFHWPDELKNLINILLEEIRQRMLKLIGSGYSTISISSLTMYLGLTDVDALSIVKPLGWKVTKDFVYPQPIPKPKKVEEKKDSLVDLTQFIMAFEKNQ